MHKAEIEVFFRQYSTGSYSEDEHDRFIKWLDSATVGEIEEVIELYRQIIEEKPVSANPPPQIVEEIELALERHENAGESPKPAKTKIFILPGIRRMAVAAVAIIVVGFFAYYLLNKKPPTGIENKAVASTSKDVKAPNSVKATITLGNGQVIFLDSINSGVLTKQGNVNIMKSSKIGIVYKNLSGQVSPGEEKYNTLFNPKGSMVVNLTLADGTKVWLNAESSLRYPVSFQGKERKVEITGEAYFEVAEDPNRQFLVDANGVVTKVLGTHFNVNAYKDGMGTIVTLLEGVVRVEKASSSVVISPGEQAVVTNDIQVKKHADLEAAMAWRNGKFIMKSIDVKEIMLQIARWYNVKVTFEKGVPDVRISGEVSRNLNLSQILQVLRYSGVHVKMSGKEVIVMPNKDENL